MIAMSKPAYLAICEYSPAKPVIIFVPSRKQCRLTVDDLLIHCAADENPDRFLNVELSELEVHLDHLRDEGLKETLKHGIGYYHEALDAQDKRIVQRLFESGAVQVLVASKVCMPRLLRNRSPLNSTSRTPLGPFRYPATWLFSWAPSTTKGRSIGTLTTPF